VAEETEAEKAVAVAEETEAEKAVKVAAVAKEIE
jgi:hypothetical protein